jgi:MFS transporter, SP family, arabinose:H+ symporter
MELAAGGARLIGAESNAVFRLAALVSLGGFVFGYDAVVISGAAPAVVAQFGLTDWQMGWIVSAPTLSAMFASLAAGYLSDRFGRRTMLRFAAALYIVSSCLSALASGFLSLSIARAIGGIAFSSLVIAPVYLAEISPSAARGRVVSMHQLAIVLGLSAAYFSNVSLQALSESGQAWVAWAGIDREAWRWMLGIELIPAVSWLLALSLWVPESPRWLVQTGRTDAARRVLSRLYPSERADEILNRVNDVAVTTRTRLRNSLVWLASPLMRTALLIGLIVGIAQQITGVNAIYFYAPVVFEQTGVGANAALFQAALIGLTNVVFTIIAMSLVDRIGRKPLLLLGLAGVGLSTTIVALAFSFATYHIDAGILAGASPALQAIDLSALHGEYFQSDVDFKNALIGEMGAELYRTHQSELLRIGIEMNAGLILTGILVFVASFAASLGPVTWVFLSEIFPNAVRGTAIALVAFVNGLVSFSVQLVFPAELATFGASVTFLFYGAAALFFFILVAVLVPETRGRNLESINEG